jgi:hypothetical protein
MVADGKLTPTGQKEIKFGKDKEVAKLEVPEETTDAYGNVIKVPSCSLLLCFPC